MALCESQLDNLHQIKSETDSGPETTPDDDKKPPTLPHTLPAAPNLNVPLAVDYRSPLSHFVPPEVEMYAVQARRLPSSSQESGSNTSLSTIESNTSGVPAVKRKRGRPRIDKTSPEYLAKSAARKQAREMAAVLNSSTESMEKRKRGRPRIDKTSPEYLARKRAKELEAMEKRAKRQYKRRTTGDSASSSTGDTTPRAKRKYTKRAGGGGAGAGDAPKKRGRKKKVILGPDGQPITPPPKVKGKRGRPRKSDVLAGDHSNANNRQPLQQPKIRVRNNLMPINNEPIPVDSEDEPDLGSPSQASDSLSLDENLRALRHLHEKYANIGKDDLYEAHLLAANFKNPGLPSAAASSAYHHGILGGGPGADNNDDEVLSIRSSPGRGEEASKVEKLEDSSDSDSDSSSSGSGSSSSGSSSSSSSGSSSSSDSSDSESERNGPATALGGMPAPLHRNNDKSSGGWALNNRSKSPRSHSGSGSDSESDRGGADGDRYGDERGASLSESENESPDKSFQCNVCKKWYSTSVTLKIHKRVHVTRGAGNSKARARSKDRYECDCCTEVFTRREKLLEHKAVAHRGAMTVRCEVCRKCFEDEAELAAHDRMHTHDERAGRCSECGASFPRYELLRRHRACAHPEAVRAPPSPAGAGGSQRVTHTCRQCGKGFGHAHSLTRHLHNHAKQLYRCVVCKASFARADQLAQHLNSHLANYKRLKP